MAEKNSFEFQPQEVLSIFDRMTEAEKMELSDALEDCMDAIGDPIQNLLMKKMAETN